MARFNRFERHPDKLRKLKECLREILGKMLDNVGGVLPVEKVRKLSRLIFEDAHFNLGGRLCRGGRVAGYTYPSADQIHICPQTFDEEPGRLCAVIFHELVHAADEGELDAEIFETTVYPPAMTGDGRHTAGTWPTSDCEDFCRDSRPAPNGERQTEHFFWDPETGRVWRKTVEGEKGDLVWDDPDVWDKWKCGPCPEVARERPEDEPYVDPFEPGDAAYRPSAEQGAGAADGLPPKLIELLRQLVDCLRELEGEGGEKPGDELFTPFPHEGGAGSDDELHAPFPHEGEGAEEPHVTPTEE